MSVGPRPSVQEPCAAAAGARVLATPGAPGEQPIRHLRYFSDRPMPEDDERADAPPPAGATLGPMPLAAEDESR